MQIESFQPRQVDLSHSLNFCDVIVVEVHGFNAIEAECVHLQLLQLVFGYVGSIIT
jgi:hypothetical protein